MKGQVYKAHSSSYSVKTDNGVYNVFAKGMLKRRNGNVVVGDFVEIDDGVIQNVLPRKNYFIRPSVSNVDCVLIVVSAEPKPDFLLIDKLIVNSLVQGTDVVLVVNKNDLDCCLCEKIESEYAKCGVKIISVCAKNGLGIKRLKEYIRCKLCLFAGQSAVGKTSLVNALFGLDLRTGELSAKNSRGRHTTTYSEIYEYDEYKVIDSPGFSVIEADATEKDLPLLYPEFLNFTGCKFRTCSHISEPKCVVKAAVEKGDISKERYSRYVIIYKELANRRIDYEKN